jgi:hypothetical protein
MIWLLLLSIIYGDTQSPFLDVHFEKHIKTYVLDKERKKHILTIYKSSKDDATLYMENEQKLTTELEYQFEQQSTSIEDLTQAFIFIGERRNELQHKMINSRLKMQKHLKEEEWKSILSEIEKDLSANEKNLDNTQARLISRFKVINGILKEKISNETSRDKILDAFSTHEMLVIDLAKDIRKHRLHDNATLRNINASREELEVVMDERNQYALDLYNTYISLHQTLAENTTTKEWKAILHEVRTVFKQH